MGVEGAEAAGEVDERAAGGRPASRRRGRSRSNGRRPTCSAADSHSIVAERVAQDGGRTVEAVCVACGGAAREVRVPLGHDADREAAGGAHAAPRERVAAGQNDTSGGSSETAANELTISPSGAPSTSA